MQAAAKCRTQPRSGAVRVFVCTQSAASFENVRWNCPLPSCVTRYGSKQRCTQLEDMLTEVFLLVSVELRS